jgi:GNAT superfamily N-acetyltransferase
MVEEAEQDRADAARQFAAAVHDYESAANHCADALSPAIADRLRDPQRHGLLDRVVHGAEGIGHAVAHGAEELGKATVRATQEYVNTYVEVAGFVVDHLDVVSEGLGLASMAAGFVPGLQGVSLGLAGAKMALDTGLALAGKGDWKTVRGDAIGFALFGAGRGLTGLARARVSVDAAAHAAEDARTIRDLASETAAGERLAQNTARITQLGNNVRHANAVVQEFAQDAGRPLMSHTVAMIRDFGTELPDGAALSLSRGAAAYATAKEGVEAYGHYGEFKEAREILEKHGLLPEHHEAGSTGSEPT